MYIGIDLGGTKIAAGLVGEDGQLMFQSSVPTKPERGPEEVIKDIISIIKKTISHIPYGEIKAIGIGMPGHVIVNTDLVFCVNLSWNGVDLKSPIENEFGLPVYIENDAKAAALAEYMVGALRGTQNSLLITLGTGVGGGMILCGELYRGSRGIASEIGHMIIGENFYNCNCGKNGCFETFASATAIIKYAKKLMETDKDTILLNILDGNLDLLESKHIIECAKQGDILSLKVVDRFVSYLLMGISNLVNILDPELTALGGGVSKAGAYLLELIDTYIASNDAFKHLRNRKIIIAELGNDAGIVGAAMLCKYMGRCE